VRKKRDTCEGRRIPDGSKKKGLTTGHRNGQAPHVLLGGEGKAPSEGEGTRGKLYYPGKGTGSLQEKEWEGQVSRSRNPLSEPQV